MSTIEIEERLSALEKRVAEIDKKQETSNETQPWWETIFGSFKDDPYYDKAMAAGRVYRESLRPTEDESDEG